MTPGFARTAAALDVPLRINNADAGGLTVCYRLAEGEHQFPRTGVQSWKMA